MAENKVYKLKEKNRLALEIGAKVLKCVRIISKVQYKTMDMTSPSLLNEYRILVNICLIVSTSDITKNTGN